MSNFMCHRLLTVQFGKNMNFVTGPNGSGKSAILAALVLGFGGKANSTGRGDGIGTFVKKGEHQGMIRLVIHNRGVDAFNHDAYGDYIIIERYLKSTGASKCET